MSAQPPDELSETLEALVLNDTAILEALAQVLSTLQKASTSNQSMLERVGEHLEERLETVTLAVSELSVNGEMPIVITGDDFLRQNPEIALLQYLSGFVSSPTAIDVGAHSGDVAVRLREAGYEVYAFEPYPPIFEELREKAHSDAGLHVFPVAVGPNDGQGVLHVAADVSGTSAETPSLFNSLVEHPMLDDVKFTQTISVPIRSLASLETSGEIPRGAGLLKIDAEGLDLDILSGVNSPSYSIVMSEFWDAQHPFGLQGHGKLEPIVQSMRARGYAWHIVVYRVDRRGILSHYYNRTDTVAESWGNAIFFCDRDLFVKATRWCNRALTPTIHR